MEDLTDRQFMALRFIQESIRARGYPPTLREIGKHMSIRSTNGVNDHLRAMERKGFIRRDDMLSRSMVLTEKAKERLGMYTTPKDRLEEAVLVAIGLFRSSGQSEYAERVARLAGIGSEAKQ